jgi:hypothetical protein
MTKLCELIMECPAVRGMDKLVLYGWAAQLVEGNETVCASKETVAGSIGVSTDTVLRKTKSLIKDGWLIETGEQKQWEFARTPVRIINIPMIVELCGAPPQIAVAPPQIAPPHLAAQGSRFEVYGLSPSVGGSCSSIQTNVFPQPPSLNTKAEDRPSDLGKPKTENLEPKTVEPKPSPTSLAKKLCPDCKEPLLRGVNHFLVCPYAKGRSTLDEYAGDMLPTPNFDSIGGGLMEFDDLKYDSKPLFPLGDEKKAEEARRREAERQKEIESILAHGRAKATATPFAQPPVAPAPQQVAKGCSGCGGREPCRDKWCYAYDPLPKSVDEIKPTGINP